MCSGGEWRVVEWCVVEGHGVEWSADLSLAFASVDRSLDMHSHMYAHKKLQLLCVQG